MRGFYNFQVIKNYCKIDDQLIILEIVTSQVRQLNSRTPQRLRQVTNNCGINATLYRIKSYIPMIKVFDGNKCLLGLPLDIASNSDEWRFRKYSSHNLNVR